MGKEELSFRSNSSKTVEISEIMINEDRLKLDNYFFRIKGGETFWRSFDALRKYAEEFELEANQVLQSTKLRKYPATVAQFLDIIQPGFKEKK